MDEISEISQFLNRIQKNWNRVRFVLGAYLIVFLRFQLLIRILFHSLISNGVKQF